MRKELWSKKQLTKEQAIAFCNNDLYEFMTNKQIVDFQLFQKRLCMPFGIFQEAITKILNRPVFTHSFAFRDNLVKEYLGNKNVPDIEEALKSIPEEKLKVIFSS